MNPGENNVQVKSDDKTSTHRLILLPPEWRLRRRSLAFASTPTKTTTVPYDRTPYAQAYFPALDLTTSHRDLHPASVLVRLPRSTHRTPGECFGSALISSKIPPRCRGEGGEDHGGEEGVILGIDEAGRGPVLGPMTYGAAYWSCADDKEMLAKGFDDSKALTPEQRNGLFDRIDKVRDSLDYIRVRLRAFCFQRMLTMPAVAAGAAVAATSTAVVMPFPVRSRC